MTKTVPEFKVKFEIWDTAGQERYHSLAPMYYRGAAAAIIVYDITSTESFNRAKNWVRELQRQGNPDLIVALAGNKADLAGQRAVEPSEAQGYADENGLYFIETSAKTSVNVGDLFEEASKTEAGGQGPRERQRGPYKRCPCQEEAAVLLSTLAGLPLRAQSCTK